MDDAENSLNRGGVETARAIFAHALGHFRSKKGVWMRACALEKKYGTAESLEQVRASCVVAKRRGGYVVVWYYMVWYDRCLVLHFALLLGIPSAAAGA